MRNAGVVVQEEICLFLEIRQFVDQRRGYCLRGDERSLRDQSERGAADVPTAVMQRCGEIVEKANRLIVVRFQREPGDAISVPAQPLRPYDRKARLAESGRRLD